ncbi:MAG TPA: aminotransferase class IV [Solirubrobacteraceae bacterium]|jgi:branched-chain amino acid aminotransferase
MEALASVDGRIAPAAEATISATDEGFLRGDGAFEVLRLYGGRAFAYEDHLARLTLSLQNLRLDADLQALRAEVSALLQTAGPVDALLRLVCTRGGRRLAFVEPLPELPESITLGAVTYAPTRVLDGIKSLSYAANMLTTRLAQERGFDEALLVTPHGRVLEGPTSSFFWVAAGRLLTPPLADHILSSITRDRVIAEMDVTEEPCSLEDLEGAEEAFLASTVREALSVRAIEQIDLAVNGPVTQEAARRLSARIEAELAAS